MQTKKHLLILLVFGCSLLVVGYVLKVFAIVPQPGHSWNEIECDTKMCVKIDNVGIGTTEPAYKLDVQGGQINSSGGFCIAGNCKTSWEQAIGGLWTQDGNNIYNANTGNVGIGVISPSQKFQVNTTTTEAFVVTSAGQVGIGTTEPTSHLSFGQAVGNITSDTADASDTKAIRITGGGSYGNTRGASIVVKGNEFSGSGGELYLEAGNIATTGVVRIYTGASERLTILDNGNVGIGTTNPNTKLNIFDNSSGPIISLQGLTTNYRGLRIADTNNTENWFAGANASNKYVIKRNGTTDDVTIDTSGNVGIGTTGPLASLEVKRTAADANFAAWIEGTNTANYGLGVNIAATTSTKAIADFRSGNTSRLFVRADGNVGIGTTSPGAKLEVVLRISQL